MTARISMADVKFSFQCPGRMYAPAWVAPEGEVTWEVEKGSSVASGGGRDGTGEAAGTDKCYPSSSAEEA